MFALRARFVLPVASPPLLAAFVAVEGDRIVAVETREPSCEVLDLGNVALLPGFVNAHTHLEFSDLTAPLGRPGMPFPDWLRQVIAWRRARDADEAQSLAARQSALRRGLDESLRFGATTLADIATPPWSDRSCADSPCQVVSFLELIGLSSARTKTREADLREQLRRDDTSGGSLGRGISPHAPYTVRWDAVHRLARLSAAAGVPLAMHLAESPAELDLMRDHRGPLRQLLEQLEVWDPSAFPPGLRPLDYLRVLATAHRSLVIHGNYLGDEEIQFLGAHRDRIALVYCPRTHAYFQHHSYPLAEILAAGACVALGTDSRASSPDLNMLAELRCAARSHPAVPPEVILYLGTLAGAEALGAGDRKGSLRAGKQADLVAVTVSAFAPADPYGFLNDPECCVARVFKSGRLAFTADSC